MGGVEGRRDLISGQSRFFVMQKTKWKTKVAAEAKIEKTEAEIIIDLLICEGQRLEAIARKCGLISGSAADRDLIVHLKKLEEYCVKHCVVLEGHLAKTFWPRFRRGSKVSEQVFLCTCEWFSQHAVCEHVYFVCGLRDKPPNALMHEPPMLDDIPIERKRGRKRCS